MITSQLIFEYEQAVGPVEFTLARTGPDREGRVAEMMREAIAGKRGPITDKELEQEMPDDAYS